jgi:hypothetical protein
MTLTRPRTSPGDTARTLSFVSVAMETASKFSRCNSDVDAEHAGEDRGGQVGGELE